MTKEENLRAIKDACGKALGYEEPVFRQDIDYTLAHVLLAHSTLACNGIGTLMIDTEGEPPKDTQAAWNLRSDNLTEQSDECLEFLANLLTP